MLEVSYVANGDKSATGIETSQCSTSTTITKNSLPAVPTLITRHSEVSQMPSVTIRRREMWPRSHLCHVNTNPNNFQSMFYQVHSSRPQLYWVWKGVKSRWHSTSSLWNFPDALYTAADPPLSPSRDPHMDAPRLVEKSPYVPIFHLANPAPQCLAPFSIF